MTLRCCKSYQILKESEEKYALLNIWDLVIYRNKLENARFHIPTYLFINISSTFLISEMNTLLTNQPYSFASTQLVSYS